VNAGGGRRDAGGDRPSRPRYGRVVLAFLILAILAATVWFSVRAFSNPSEPAVPDDARAPDGVRIKVEVLNATTTRGLARKATDFLRDRGFDVVGSGNDTQPRAKTVVYDRSSHPDWARLVGLAMNAPVVSRPDSSRYLDVTVLIGADWRPPPLPFHP